MKRVLFIAPNRIGDAVLASGVLAQLLERYPDALFTIATGPLPGPLFADMPRLEQVITVTKQPGNRHWLKLWLQCAKIRWSLAADLRGSLFPYCVPAGRRLVLWPEKRREHRIEELGRQLRLAELPGPKLWVSAARQARISALFPPGPPILAVGPTANWPGKQWPIERFVDAVRRLSAADGILPGARVAVLGAAGERPTARPLLDSVPAERRIDLVGHPDLLDVFAILRGAAFYLGNDSGLMHMAAAAGIPTLGLFGPSHEWRYGPWGPATSVVRTKESYDQLVTDNPAFDGGPASLMTGLAVEEVLAAATDLWRRTGGSVS